MKILEKIFGSKTHYKYGSFCGNCKELIALKVLKGTPLIGTKHFRCKGVGSKLMERMLLELRSMRLKEVGIIIGGRPSVEAVTKFLNKFATNVTPIHNYVGGDIILK